MNNMTPRELTTAEVDALFLNKPVNGHYEPRGLFYYRKGFLIIGIDNSTGEAWTEEFSSLDLCLAWLNDKTIRHVQCYECAYAAERNGEHYCNFGDSDRYGKPVSPYTGCTYGEEN